MNARQAIHALLTLALGGVGVTSAVAQDSSDRAEREGPYRSRMRIIEETHSAPSVVAPTDSAFATALNARAQGYLAAREGNTDEAIEKLQASLDTNVLAPVAARAVVQDILTLLIAAKRPADAIQTYRDHPTLRQNIEPEVSMGLAQAAVELGDFELALRATDAALTASSPPPAWRDYKVYVLAQLQRYDEAAALGARNLALSNTDATAWRRLIELQRAAKQPQRAVATAEIGFDRGVLTDTRDVILLSRLYLATGLPDHAAVALVRHHGRVEPTGGTLTLLLRAQRGAGSTAAALATARELSALDDSADHLLLQAQLEHELEDAPAAVATLRRALRKNLGQRRGQALLLLGENQVAVGALREARRAFTQASEIGGVYRDALAWLARLDGLDTATNAAAAGPTTEAVTDDGTLTPEQAGPDQPLVASADVTIKQLPRIRFFHATAQATLDTLPDVAKKLQRRVSIGLRRERLSAAGPLRWRVDGRALVAGQTSAIELGVPVSTSVPPRGRFKNADLPAFTAAVREYSGTVTGLAVAWRQLTEDTIAAGHTPGADARTVVMEAPGSEGTGRFELQLEIIDTP